MFLLLSLDVNKDLVMCTALYIVADLFLLYLIPIFESLFLADKLYTLVCKCTDQYNYKFCIGLVSTH